MATKKKKKKGVKRRRKLGFLGGKNIHPDIILFGGLTLGNFISDVGLNLIEDHIPQAKESPYVAPGIMAGGGYFGYKALEKQEAKASGMTKALFGVLKYASANVAANGLSEIAIVTFPQLQGQLGDIVRNAFQTAGRTIPHTEDIANTLNGSNLETLGLMPGSSSMAA